MIAQVIVDISNSEVDRIFDYLIPSDFELSKGDRVMVPFGNRSIEGFVINFTEEQPSKYELKYIERKLDETPLISEEMLALMEFMKSKFYIRYVDSLRLFIPNKLRGNKVKKLIKEFVTLTASPEEIKSKINNRAKSQLAIVDRLSVGGEYLTVLNTEFSNSAVNALLKSGMIKKEATEIYRKPYKGVSGRENSVKMTSEQLSAMDTVFKSQSDTILLHGVTGSGKTEVYLNCIEKVLNEGKTAIMLVPEISLTPQILRLFRSRFGETVAMMHSGLSDGERYDEWRRLYQGDAKIAIGARSAIFAPLRNIGIIIIDEEHDSSYISESNPRFTAVAVAEFRTKYNKAKLILGSATPSIETYNKTQSGEYGIAVMNNRISRNGMPDIEIVDMAKELRQGNTDIFSRELKQSIIETVKAGNQAIIFLNRRGYASFMMCKECGYIAKCTDCDIALTYHSEDNLLKCHYCGKRYKALTECPECHGNSIRQGKVGTERVVSEIKKLLPDVKILRMDNDTTSTKSAYLDILGAFACKEAQILVGTQMIAKGHDFPDVTLVGVLDADMSLYFSDYRSAERTYQLITQVSGRAGRSDKEGKVVIQTYSPKHYIFNYVRRNDYLGFYEKEINTREITDFPPFTTIIRILVTGTDEEKTVETAKDIYVKVKNIKEKNNASFIYLQAMKSPITRLQNKYRYQIIMRIKRKEEYAIIKSVHEAVDSANKRGVAVFVEINPQSMS